MFKAARIQNVLDPMFSMNLNEPNIGWEIGSENVQPDKPYKSTCYGIPEYSENLFSENVQKKTLWPEHDPASLGERGAVQDGQCAHDFEKYVVVRCRSLP